MRLFYSVILVFICCVLLYYCKSETSQSPIILANDSSLYVIKHDPGKSKKINFSSLAEKIDYVLLETTEESTIGNIDKIIICDSLIFISDVDITYSVFCFSLDGKFLFRINKYGKGPNEYIRLTDFTIDTEKKKIIIYDEQGKKFHHYNFKGEFIESIKSELYLFRFSYIGRAQLLCYSGYLPNPLYFKDLSYSFFILNDELKLTGKFLPFDPKENLFFNIPIIRNNISDQVGAHYVYMTSDNKIYKLTDEGLKPYFKLDFGKYNIDFDFIKKNDIRHQKELCKSGQVILGLEDFQIVGNWVFTMYIFKRGLYFKAYNFNTKIGMDYSQVINDIDYFPISFLPPYFSSNNSIISVIEPYLIVKVKDIYNKMGKVPFDLQKIDSNSNPMLQIVTLKE